MIIKSIFRRYERWNPVHPTSGAFWGVGVGIGCGIGWGPGFGPEVVGYVGAGCGSGFSVGITFLGFGIGLPANYILQLPASAVKVTTRGAWDVAQAGVVLGKKGLEGDGWGRISSNISEALQNPYQYVPFFSFKAENWKGNIVDFEGMKTSVASNAKQITDCFQRVGGRFSPWDGAGSKNL
ncbi:cadmium-induced protein AS8-like isoform X2 [Salvia miltiorrhiza]|uniref:cadmium-induced protein AS8-like isoform X2 n=1 Tax=Salvia miltiorrhiza TaxID=226208 RepID=UPI0025AC30B9|nr:cadmium-induced protein AS8-like isoform X2 [Salvia miltiorrhiza]XP_057766646.1 cadmium-induced protein AS8-like isoform X2 [Salvia miltiorrhiza]XP_057766648.1 cadmium-induced protein AS8-like isoform X2 [Salvia miltiorrhiza]